MKKAISIILALVMVFSISSIAFAEDELAIIEEVAAEEVASAPTEEEITPISEGENNGSIKKVIRKTYDSNNNFSIEEIEINEAEIASDRLELTENDIGRVIESGNDRGSIYIKFTPKVSGEYQIELEETEEAMGYGYSIISDDLSLLEATVFYSPRVIHENARGIYINVYLRPGYYYSFGFDSIKYLRLMNEPVDEIKLDEKVLLTPQYQSIYRFTSKTDATYNFTVSGKDTDDINFKPNVYLYKNGLFEPVSVGDEVTAQKKLNLKKGESCYVTSNRGSETLEVSIGEASDVAFVHSMYLSEQYGSNPDVEQIVDSFKINHATGLSVANTKIEKPWITVALDKNSNAATAELADAKGKKIAWKEEAITMGNMKIYATQLGIKGASREYKLTLTPESGNTAKNVEYSLLINPKPAKPTGFKATASKKSDTITLTWNKSAYTTGYKIYRSETKDDKYYHVKTLKSANTLRFNDQNLNRGKKYYYKLIPYSIENGKTTNGTASNIVSATVRK